MLAQGDSLVVALGTQKARGAFFTPLEVSEFIARWAIRSKGDRVLEPSCGDAAFLLPAAATLSRLGIHQSRLSRQLHGIEIHASSVANARDRLADEGFTARIEQGDFFDRELEPSYDAVIGNPPFVRYQDFSGAVRAKAQRLALQQGAKLTALASSWAAFTVYASGFLKDDGRLGFVLPAELLSVNYASEVRRFLLNRFAKVRLVLFEQLIFPGVLEEVVLLLAEGRGGAKSFEVHQARNAADLTNVVDTDWRDFPTREGAKWTPALIQDGALDTYHELTASDQFTTLEGWGDTSLGSVTGNNKFFTLTNGDVRRLGLERSEVLPISPPGSRHLRGLTFAKECWRELRDAGARCYLFAPRGSKLSKGAKAYIEDGEARGVDQAYKCRARLPWWRVPLLDAPDLLFTYMNHDRPRLVTNDADARVLNSLYGVTLRADLRGLGRATLPIASLNTLTLLGSEVVGRAYGGGLLKHEPKEADLLPVPSPDALGHLCERLTALRPQLYKALHSGNVGKAVEKVDRFVLDQHMGLSNDQLGELRAAREALFQRRTERGRGKRG